MTRNEVIDALNEFVRTQPVQRLLHFVNGLVNKPNDWESTLQIEFAMFLSEQAYSRNTFKWWREYRIVTGETNSEEYIIPDFWILNTEANAEPGSYFIIEFKRSNDGSVVRKMKEEDLIKWQSHIKARHSELECRGYTINHNSGVFLMGIDLIANHLPNVQTNMAPAVLLDTGSEPMPLGHHYLYFLAPSAFSA